MLAWRDPGGQLRIIGMCVGAGAVYGIIHDQVTARLSIEYFTVAHPIVISSSSPTLLGLVWGIIATAPIALLVGWFLSAIAHSPNLPREPLPKLGGSISILFLVMGGIAAAAGIIGWKLAEHHAIELPLNWSEVIVPEHRAGFIAAWFAHVASYGVGLVGSAILLWRLWVKRNRPRVISLLPPGPVSSLRFALLLVVAAILIIWRTRAS